jgi:hypothetical protein
MSDWTRSDRLLEAWLDLEAPPGVPDGLRDDILTATGRIRPRPAWLARLKGNHMEVLIGGRPRQASRLVPILLTLALLAAIVAGVVSVGSNLLRRDTAVTPSGPVTLTMPDPIWGVVAGDDNALWVSTCRPSCGSPTAVHRLDVATHGLQTIVPQLPIGPVAVAVLGGSVWGPSGDAAVRFDATTGERLATIPVGSSPLEPLAAFGSVWFPNFRGHSVTRIDPATGTPTDIVIDGWTGGPRALWAGHERVLAVSVDDREIASIDPGTNVVTLIGSIPFQACSVAESGGRVWAFRCENGSVQAFDPATGAPVGEYVTDQKVAALLDVDGQPWMISTAVDLAPVVLIHVDPSTFRETARYEPPIAAGGVSQAFGSLWFSDGATLLRIPLDVLPK